ncbi:hypothetical protein C8Q78DRAFT_1015239 [Trametes maxima]|nr:hypothetical protein C8Q78DRAFT_1015239 [Trametes maxima]
MCVYDHPAPPHPSSLPYPFVFFLLSSVFCLLLLLSDCLASPSLLSSFRSWPLPRLHAFFTHSSIHPHPHPPPFPHPYLPLTTHLPACVPVLLSIVH